MTFRLTDLTPEAVLHVAQNMRARDREEIFAMRWADATADDVAADCMACPGFSWIGWWKDAPVAVIGAMPMWPGVWSVYCFATDDFRQIVIQLSRHVRRVMIPGLIKAGAHRATCFSLASYGDAHRWLEILGAQRELEFRGYGRNREDFVLFSWRN